jgi:hypothetical protein
MDQAYQELTDYAIRKADELYVDGWNESWRSETGGTVLYAKSVKDQKQNFTITVGGDQGLRLTYEFNGDWETIFERNVYHIDTRIRDFKVFTKYIDNTDFINYTIINQSGGAVDVRKSRAISSIDTFMRDAVAAHQSLEESGVDL